MYYFQIQTQTMYHHVHDERGLLKWIDAINGAGINEFILEKEESLQRRRKPLS